MTVTEAILSRRSVRAFLDKPVSTELIAEILKKACWAPSGGNVQPWQIYVLSGDAMARFKAIMQQRLLDCPEGEMPLEYQIYPQPLKAPYRDYRWKNAEDYYGLVGIPREDKAARRKFFSNNYRFFDAPSAVVCYVDRQMGSPQWSDLGMFLENVMLLAREAGLHTCAQECWSHYHRTMREFLNSPEEWMLFCAVAIGYEDTEAQVNRMRADRAPIESWCRFVTD